LLVNPDLSLSGAIHLHIICRVPLGDWFLLFVRLLAFVIGFILRQISYKDASTRLRPAANRPLNKFVSLHAVQERLLE